MHGVVPENSGRVQVSILTRVGLSHSIYCSVYQKQTCWRIHESSPLRVAVDRWPRWSIRRNQKSKNAIAMYLVKPPETMHRHKSV